MIGVFLFSLVLAIVDNCFGAVSLSANSVSTLAAALQQSSSPAMEVCNFAVGLFGSGEPPLCDASSHNGRSGALQLLLNLNK